MKASRASDYWRRLSRKKSLISLEEFVVKGIRGVLEGKLAAKGALNVLCGANGTGKSTILESVHLTLTGKRPLLHFGNAVKFAAAELAAHLLVEDKPLVCSYTASGSKQPLSEDIEVVWLNPGSYSGFLQREFTLTKNFDEYLEGSPQRQFSADELKEISYLVCREYSEVTVTEIEDFEHMAGFEGPEVIPFFTVTAGGVTYRSQEMGIGEHALFLLHWYTQRVRTKSILFIEELETHVSFQSQIHVLNHLVMQSMDRNVWIMLTTHSPAILERVPLEFIQLCQKNGADILVNDSPTQTDLALSLGVRIRKSGICLVEDAAAKAFLIAIFQILRREFALYFEVIVAGSTGHIDKALANFPPVGEWMKIMGVYDADASLDGSERKNGHQSICLPGKKSPELEIIFAIKNNLAVCAQSLEISVEKLSVALAGIEGFDEHDWFAELVRALGVNYETGMRMGVATWLTIEANRTMAERFIQEIEITRAEKPKTR